jgi:hypothetical protein
VKWQPDGLMAHTSHADTCDGRAHTPECGRFTINRSPAPGFPAPRGITYMLVDRGRIVHVERSVANTHTDTLRATKACKAKAAEVE